MGQESSKEKPSKRESIHSVIHFWAEIEFLPGKARPLGWRPDFFYTFEKHGYMIWPVAKDGDIYGMFVLDQELWENLHHERCTPGCQFLLKNGAVLLAHGEVVDAPPD